jgi:hypothetical protein
MDEKFAIKTLNPTQTTIKVKVGEIEYEMLLSNFILNIISSNILLLDNILSTSLQNIKNSTGETSALKISTETIKLLTAAAYPFIIKGKDVSGSVLDLECFTNVGDEYISLRMRGTLSEYLSQIYYFRAASTQDYLGIQVNLTDLIQLINEGTVTETLIPNGKLGIGVAKTGISNTSNIDSSAKVQINSTTQGFLPPRMTTGEIDAIISPVNGLQVYNTTINHPCFYMNGAWVRINHSPM